jgi:methylisocitrate lyase
MRTVREFALGGIAGIHIEDQLYPKRAHYHRHQADATDVDAYVQKIRYACRERDEVDRDFVIIARTDTCRFQGLGEAADRINRAADEGADLGLLFPRNRGEAERAPAACRLPLVYVQSRGNSDGRPLFSMSELKQMGYVACIDAQIVVATAYHFLQSALTELRQTGLYTGIPETRFVEVRKAIEDLIDLEKYYAIEEQTVLKGVESPLARHAKPASGRP